ncbi:hypothetical protein BC831DRAFT_471691 [Entophlyctis helioformis]|nr:hypothetical protein BC831DRAFT_471691 [Entophlyctis helioformis]
MTQQLFPTASDATPLTLSSTADATAWPRRPPSTMHASQRASHTRWVACPLRRLPCL